MRRAPLALSSAYAANQVRPTTELPAGAVAAATTAASRATTHLLVAVAAIDGFVATRLEGHTRLVPAVGAGGGEHLPLAPITTIAAATHGGLARGAALWATGRRMHQPTGGVEFLLAGCEHKVTPALATPECLIGGQDQNLSSGQVRPRALTVVIPQRCGTDLREGRTLWERRRESSLD